MNIQRDFEGRVVGITDSEGRSVAYAYDGHGNLQRVTDPEGNVTRFKYAQNHYLLEIIDPRGVRAVRTEFDEQGRMVRQISPAGDTMSFDHDSTARRSHRRCPDAGAGCCGATRIPVAGIGAQGRLVMKYFGTGGVKQ